MKQLDRIEYLLAEKNISWSPHSLNMLGGIVWVWFAFITMGLLFYLAFEKLDLILVLKNFMPLFKWLLILTLTYDIFSFVHYLQKRRKLDKYFLKK